MRLPEILLIHEAEIPMRMCIFACRNSWLVKLLMNIQINTFNHLSFGLKFAHFFAWFKENKREINGHSLYMLYLSWYFNKPWTNRSDARFVCLKSLWPVIGVRGPSLAMWPCSTFTFSFINNSIGTARDFVCGYSHGNFYTRHNYVMCESTKSTMWCQLTILEIWHSWWKLLLGNYMYK